MPMMISLEGSINPEILEAPEGSAEEQAIRRVMIQQTLAEMKKLDKRIWLAFRGMYLEKKPVAQIAEELKVSVTWVYQLAAKGKQMLREALEEDD